MPPPPATIFALSSGRVPAAIAVVRISGPRAGDALIALAGKLPPPRKASLARLHDPVTGEPIDEALALWFPGPNSETGEDTAELHLHGGRAVLAAALHALDRLDGLRPAEAGEFTRRAFENGRLDLTAVEGLADLVAAETEGQRRQALRQMQGALRARAEAWRERLIGAMALVEAGIDFADEGDVPDELTAPARAIARELEVEIASALRDAARGERLRDGLVVAIAGPPNAGKSTLLNRLARREVAIVSPQAGTTRDIIEVHLDLDGWPVTLLDTAGIRETADPVEMEGVRRARARATAADLVLWVVDATGPMAEADARCADIARAADPDSRRAASAHRPHGGGTGVNGNAGSGTKGGAGSEGRSVIGSEAGGRAVSGADSGADFEANAYAGRNNVAGSEAKQGVGSGAKANADSAGSKVNSGSGEATGAGSEARPSGDSDGPGGTGSGMKRSACSGANGGSEAKGGSGGESNIGYEANDTAVSGTEGNAGAIDGSGEASVTGSDMKGGVCSRADSESGAKESLGDKSGPVSEVRRGIGSEPGEIESCWLVCNKADLLRAPAAETTTAKKEQVRIIDQSTNYNNEQIIQSIEYQFTISCKTGEGLDRLLGSLTAAASRMLGASEPALVTRERQRLALEEARAALARAADGPIGEDLLAEELRLAAYALVRLTGRIDVEDILDVIFRDFCVGK